MTEIIKNQQAGYFELKDKPSEEELKAYYKKVYYQEDRGAYSSCYSESELNFKNNKIKLKAHVADLIRTEGTGRRLLDVGCGEGFVLEYFDSAGWDVEGLDFSKYGCISHNPRVSGKVLEGNIYEHLNLLAAKGEKYDLIWLDNVLEHVREVENLLDACRKLAFSHTILSITVPNDFSKMQMSLLDEGVINNKFWVKSPDHLSYFTVPTLKKQLEIAGWSTETIIADFPIDWFLTNDVTNYINIQSVGKPAHHSRVWLFNHIMTNNSMDAAVKFFEGLAHIGMGRNITGFFKMNN